MEKIIARKIPPFLTGWQDKASLYTVWQGREGFSPKAAKGMEDTGEAREDTKVTSVSYQLGGAQS